MIDAQLQEDCYEPDERTVRLEVALPTRCRWRSGSTRIGVITNACRNASRRPMPRCLSKAMSSRRSDHTLDEFLHTADRLGRFH